MAAIATDHQPTSSDSANNNAVSFISDSTHHPPTDSPNGNSDSGVDTEPAMTPASASNSSALDIARVLSADESGSTGLSRRLSMRTEYNAASATERPLAPDEPGPEVCVDEPAGFADVDEDDDASHSSSLESEESEQRRANERFELSDDGDDGSSTSCSVDSFEIASPADTMRSLAFDAHKPTTSTTQQGASNGLPSVPGVDKPNVVVADERTGSAKSGSTDSFQRSLSEAARQSIHDELNKLDTALPQLDFDRLEQQLNTAAKEREMSQRRLLGEQVRRRLAMEADEGTSGVCFPPAPTTRPKRSNLGHRLQTGMNLQVCFMNDATPADDDAGSSSGEDDDDFGAVPKSHSTPNLGARRRREAVNRSVSSVGDASNLRASEIRQKDADAQPVDSKERRLRLEAETRTMLHKAKQAAHMQMEVERQAKATRSPIEDVIGVPLARKLSRVQLSKMGVTQLQIIVNELHTKIEGQNQELVQLLIQRDSLHMEQDSMLVDIEDMIQHQRSDDVALPAFLYVEAPPTHTAKSGVRFRIFKR